MSEVIQTLAILCFVSYHAFSLFISKAEQGFFLDLKSSVLFPTMDCNTYLHCSCFIYFGCNRFFAYCLHYCCQIPGEADLVTAATIAVNPGTAYRMLKDFIPVSCGDTVIQNGANSAVGQAVIQVSEYSLFFLL